MPQTKTIPEIETPVKPREVPWQEEYTDPWEICPQQKRELASPDVEP
jgi:hypothetical protein